MEKIIILVVISGGIYMLTKYLKDIKKFKKNNYEKIEVDKEKNIKKIIEELLRDEENRKKFIAYVAYKKAKELGCNKEQIEKIFEHTGRVTIRPYLNYKKVPISMQNDLGNGIRKFLKEKGFNINENKSMEYNLEKYFMKKIEHEAEKIVEGISEF